MFSGNYLDQKSAARIGLIPEKLLKKTVSVGNAAQKGAIDTAYIYEDHDTVRLHYQWSDQRCSFHFTRRSE